MTDFPTVEGVEHRFVEARGLRMHVAEAGAGEPLLLVHGWPQHWYQWRGVMQRLAGERRLIVPDLRGFGWTDAPPGPIEPDVFVGDLIALLDALGIERTDLAGHDWGGFTSLLLAARHPERFRKVVALSTPHPWIEITPRLALETWRAWYAVLLLAGGLTERSKLAAWFIRREGVPRRTSRSTSSACAIRASARPHAAVPLLPADAHPTRCGAPRRSPPDATALMLLMIGENDMAVTPRLAEGLDRGGDDLRFELIPRAGHFVCDTHAHVVAERIRSFL